MYANPAHIRHKRINLSVNEDEMRVIEAISALNRQQVSTFLRELVMEQLAVHAAESAAAAQELRALQA